MVRYQKDWLIVLGVVMVIAGMYGTLIFVQKNRLIEVTVINELRSMRLAVAAFYYANGRSPKDLQELADGTYEARDGKKKGFLPKNVTERGLKDPMGRPYAYDADTGWVKSSSEKYINW